MNTVVPEARSPEEALAGAVRAGKTGCAEREARIGFATPELPRDVLTAERRERLKIPCGAGPVSTGEAARPVGRDVRAAHGDIASRGPVNRGAEGRLSMRRLLPKVARSFLCLLVALLFAGCGNSYYRGPVSAHFDGRKFDNPWAPMPDRFGDFLKWRLTADRGPWPEYVPVTPSTPPMRVPDDTLRVTYVGHCTVLLQTQALNILTDPIWSERASPLSFAGPKRVAAPGVRFEDLPPIDVVLVSHNHYDHLDLPTLERLVRAFNPLVLVPLGNDAIMLGAVPGMRVKALDWGESFEVNRQVRFTLEPMQHWSARSLFDRRDALWGAFVVEAPGGPIYFLADAGYAKSLSETFVARYGTPRFSLLPVGAYEPRWFMQYAHMTPAEAVQTYLDLGEGYAMGTQHEVFAMADDAYAAPRRALAEALEARGIERERFLLPEVGGWFTVPPR